MEKHWQPPQRLDAKPAASCFPSMRVGDCVPTQLSRNPGEAGADVGEGWDLASSPFGTAPWRAGQQWTVPVGGGFGRVFKVGDQSIDASVFTTSFASTMVRPGQRACR